MAGLLALVDARATGVINLGAPTSVDLLDFAQRVAAHYGGGARIDAEAANVALFAADRPPADGARLRAATGYAPPPFEPALIAAQAAWLDAHHGTPVSQSAT